jgi:hypothetical protein
MKHLVYLFLLFACKGNNDEIKIDVFLTKYKQNQNIEFEISNNESEKKYYYISLEYCENQEWSELINDVSEPKSNISVINVIRSNEKIKQSISIKKVLYLKNFLNFKKYRFKIVYGKSEDKLLESYFSNSFEIVK